MRHSLRTASLIALALLLNTACGGSGSGGSATTKTWTYMVYLGADNSLSDAGLADLAEMESVGSSDDVNIVVQAEFTGSDTLRFLVNHDNDATTANTAAGTSQGNLDMGVPATLTAFIQWAQTNYPADHYALVIWDHGDGWKSRNPALTKGAVQDVTSGTFMSLPDLATGVSNAGVHFDVINFDACLMGMYEIAYQFSGLTDYLVGSEETEPGDGNPYNTILTALTGTPTMTGRQLAIQTVDDYNAFYAAQNRDATTLSVIDMAQVSELDTRVRALSAAMAADDADNAVFVAAETNTQVYEEAANHDLQDYCQYLVDNLGAGAVETAAQSIIDFIPTVVAENKTTLASVANSYGIAIYMPSTAQTTTTDLASYALLASNLSRDSVSGTWGDFVEDLTEEQGGATLQTAVGGFSVEIDWDCDADVDLYIGEPDGSAAPGNLVAPWMGTTTTNGFFSGDSAVTGENSESYLSGDTVASGDYYILINYYANGTSCTSTSVRLLIKDAENGIATLTEVNAANGFTTNADSPHTMSLTNSWDGSAFSDPLDLNAYSDWWVPLVSTRFDDGASLGTPEDLPTPSKHNEIIFRLKKGSRIF